MLVALALNVLALALYSVALLTSLGKTSRALHGFDTQLAVEGTTTTRKWVDKTGNCQTVVRKRLFCLTLAVSDVRFWCWMATIHTTLWSSLNFND